MITSIEQLQAWLANGEYTQVRQGAGEYTLSDDEGNVVTFYSNTQNAYLSLRVKPDEKTVSNIEKIGREQEMKDLQARLNELQSI